MLLGYGDTTLTVKPLKATSNSTTGASSNLEIITRELDADNPNVEKKWKKVYISYKNANNLKLYYNGVSKADGEIGWTEITSPSFTNAATWTTTGFPIGKNAYTMKIKVVANGAVPYNFEINDITLVFRTKTVK